MYSLLQHNTFGINASCREFKEYSSISELRELLPSLHTNKWLHIGAGSNLLFVKDFDGIVLHSKITDCELLSKNDDNIWLRVGAGFIWDEFVDYCVCHQYYGLENLSYIPGEVGASAVQNIGAYGIEACQFIEEVEVMDVATGQIKVYNNAQCQYAYRKSIFKQELRGKCIVTHVTYRLSSHFSPDLEYAAVKHALQTYGISKETLTAQQLRDVITKVRQSKLPDPKEIGSAGSFFMNPVVDEHTFNLLLKQYPDMPHYVMPNGIKIPAGWMIEQCGWKGKNLGKAGVYSKQAIVLVNLGGATGQDIVNLSNTIINDVKAKFGIDIYPEANFIE